MNNKDFIHQLWNRLKKKLSSRWTIKDYALYILALVLFLTTLSFLLSTIEKWGLPVALAALAVAYFNYASKEKKKEIEQQKFITNKKILYNFLYYVFHGSQKRSLPIPVNDVTNIGAIRQHVTILYKNGVPILHAMLFKKDCSQFCGESELLAMKDYIQAHVSSYLKINGLPEFCQDEEYPFIMVDEVRDEGVSLFIDLILVDNEQAIDYLEQRQMDELWGNSMQVNADDEEF